MSTPLRVVMVTHYFAAHGGGIERVAEALCAQLARAAETHVTWFATDADPAPEGGQFESVRVPAWHGIERWLGLPYPVWTLRSLRLLAQAVARADIVHVHDYLYMGSLAAMLFARWQGKPVVVTQHVGLIPYRNPLLRGILSTLNRTLGRYMLGRADQVVFIAATVRDYFQCFVTYRSPPALIANGVNSDLFESPGAERRSELKRELGVGDSEMLALFVGRFVEKKGLGIVRELVAATPSVRWVLVGEGPMDPSSWQFSNLRVYPFMPHQVLRNFYQAADLLVLPSKGEGFPLVVQEAMSCGTPVFIGSEYSQGQPVPPNLRFAAPVEHEDPVPQWKKEFAAIVADPRTLQDMRPAVAACARNLWSWARCVAEYRGLYCVLRSVERKASP